MSSQPMTTRCPITDYCQIAANNFTRTKGCRSGVAGGMPEQWLLANVSEVMTNTLATCSPRWSHFGHDADIGVIGVGPTKSEAFRQGALALTAVVTDPGRVCPRERVAIACEAPNDEFLFVEWLNALIYEMAVRGMLFGDFAVEVEGTTLRATAYGEAVDVQRHQPAVEIKGATLTALKVVEERDGWHAECVVDV